MTRRLHTGGYVYHSDPHATLERQRCSQDRFPVKTAILLVGIAFAAVLFAIFPAASDAPASGSTSHVAEAGVGRGGR